MEQRPAETYINVCRQRKGPDWAHAPLSFKLYLGGGHLPLSGATLAALSVEQAARSTCSLGLLLHEIYGIMRMSAQSALPRVYLSGEMSAPEDSVSPWLGRAVASGGARYPGELYVLVSAGPGPAPGLYHYDPLHHTLDLLRTGHFFPTLFHALAQPPQKLPTYTLLYSCLFWKDAFKYQEFSYRLQGLDIGCLLAQTQAVSERSGFRPRFHFRFLDEQLDQLLGLKPLEESVYAVVTLEEGATETVVEALSRPVPAIAPADELPGTREQYEPLSRWPLLERVHRASRIQTPEELQQKRTVPALPVPASATDLVIHLPPVAPLQLGARMTQRRSAWAWEYRAHPLALEQLACLLQAATGGYSSDLDGEGSRLGNTLLYCLINQVDGVPPGIYVYLPEPHALQQVAPGDPSPQFQAVQTDLGWNMQQVSLVLIPVGHYARGFAAYGDRWYRMQNMEAGLCVQRLYLATAQNGLLCRAQLSFDDTRLDALLQLPTDYTSLIQVLISPYEPQRPARKEAAFWIHW